jgi:hypothetical protein
MKIWRAVFVALCATMAPATARAQDFNAYVLKSIEHLHPLYAKGGYDLNQAFTHDIRYGTRGVVKASAPARTMCVAAVTEVILYAINKYAETTGDATVYDKIPLFAWTQGNMLSLRANIFMFGGTGSLGTGHTLKDFRLGDELAFEQLKAGDFVNLNRTNGSGHAVVFLGFLTRDSTLLATHDASVVGFRYFSAQGGSDNGFGYRNAFFTGNCPTRSSLPTDCNIMRSPNRALLNLGRMWEPARWDYLNAVAGRKARTRSALEGQFPVTRGVELEALLEYEVNRELSWSPEQARFFANDMTN